MGNLTMRRIHYAADAATDLAKLRQQLSLQADVVSPRGRQLTEQVFGQPLTPAQVVERICTDVRQRGLPAVLHYTEQFDRVRLTAETVRVSIAELQEAHGRAAPEFLATIRRVRQNVLSFQMGLLHARRRAQPARQARAAAALSADAARRRVHPGRGGGVSVDAADDRLPGPGGGRQGNRRGHAADAERRVQPATCWRHAGSWASARSIASAARRRSRRWPTGPVRSARWT